MSIPVAYKPDVRRSGRAFICPAACCLLEQSVTFCRRHCSVTILFSE